ncbi:restriction endonuclease subunit S [bacterium]|nr:restriction endonuclease subunit S [bacterium]
MNVAEREALRPKGSVPNKREQQQTRLNVPALRFPEFKGEWKTYAIGEILSIGSGRDYKQLELGDTPVFGTGGLMTRVNQCLMEGESVFIGRKGTINRPFYYCGKFWTVDTLFYTHSFINVIPKFVLYLFETIDWLKYNEASGVPSLSKSTIEKIIVKLPSIAEQTKIARLLTILDDRIATQRKIIEDLEKLKSAIYHKVFSTIKGETVALTSVANIVKGKQLNGEELSDSGTYYVMNGGIVPSGYYHEYNTPENTISISEGGNSCGYVQFNHKPFWSGGHCYTLHLSNESVNLLFLYHFLKYKEKDIMALRIGSGLPNIQKRTLGNFPVLLPSINEQNKVVRLFEAIQQKVGIDIKILHQLLIQKQYLLQQMFI